LTDMSQKSINPAVAAVVVLLAIFFIGLAGWYFTLRTSSSRGNAPMIRGVFGNRIAITDRTGKSVILTLPSDPKKAKELIQSIKNK